MSLVGGKRKKGAFAKTCNGSGYAEKRTKRQPFLHSREFRESFVKTWLDNPNLLKAWTSGLQKIESLQTFVKFSYCYVVGKRTFIS